MTPARALAALLSLALAGCAAPPPGPAPGDEDADVFRGAEAIFTDFPPARPSAHPAGGDRVLLGIDVQGRGEHTVRYLLVQLDGTRPAGPWRMDLTWGRGRESVVLPARQTLLVLHDEQARPLSLTPGSMPEVVLRHGLYAAARVVHEHGGSASPADAAEDETVKMGFIALACMTRALSGNPVLNELLLSAVERPSLLGVLFGGGPKLEFRHPAPIRAGTARLGGGEPVPALTIPLRLAQGRRPLLEIDVTVVEPAAPLGLCGGVVAVDARNPARPEAAIRVRLLGARRGLVPAPGPPEAVTKRAQVPAGSPAPGWRQSPPGEAAGQ